MYPNPKTQPKILGPGGFYDKKWFDTFLDASGHDVIDGVTHHIYNLGPGNNPDVVRRVQDPFFLTQIAQTFKDVSNAIDKFAPWSGAWVSESGGAYNSGGQLVSYTFAFGFWYLDQLGMTSVYNHKVYCRPGAIMLFLILPHLFLIRIITMRFCGIKLWGVKFFQSRIRVLHIYVYTLIVLKKSLGFLSFSSTYRKIPLLKSIFSMI
ncbi:hypothetical protein Godav_009754 [Gossypium davidsonii]|uniref:Uncharacterized protein n=1 Tax=Gossypium davidsonii TaxID=34287 RepID=A0A7J8SEP2_GOSDV|nr:hypothetical protein [Gossypium davidsonii]